MLKTPAGYPVLGKEFSAAICCKESPLDTSLTSYSACFSAKENMG